MNGLRKRLALAGSVLMLLGGGIPVGLIWIAPRSLKIEIAQIEQYSSSPIIKCHYHDHTAHEWLCTAVSPVVTFKISNPNLFDVVLQDATVTFFLGDVGIDSENLPEDRYIIPAGGHSEFKVLFWRSLEGTHEIYETAKKLGEQFCKTPVALPFTLELKGQATCNFRHAFIQVSSKYSCEQT